MTAPVSTIYLQNVQTFNTLDARYSALYVNIPKIYPNNESRNIAFKDLYGVTTNSTITFVAYPGDTFENLGNTYQLTKNFDYINVIGVNKTWYITSSTLPAQFTLLVNSINNLSTSFVSLQEDVGASASQTGSLSSGIISYIGANNVTIYKSISSISTSVNQNFATSQGNFLSLFNLMNTNYAIFVSSSANFSTSIYSKFLATQSAVSSLSTTIQRNYLEYQSVISSLFSTFVSPTDCFSTVSSLVVFHMTGAKEALSTFQDTTFLDFSKNVSTLTANAIYGISTNLSTSVGDARIEFSTFINTTFITYLSDTNSSIQTKYSEFQGFSTNTSAQLRNLHATNSSFSTLFTTTSNILYSTISSLNKNSIVQLCNYVKANYVPLPPPCCDFDVGHIDCSHYPEPFFSFYNYLNKGFFIPHRYGCICYFCSKTLSVQYSFQQMSNYFASQFVIYNPIQNTMNSPAFVQLQTSILNLSNYVTMKVTTLQNNYSSPNAIDSLTFYTLQNSVNTLTATTNTIRTTLSSFSTLLTQQATQLTRVGSSKIPLLVSTLGSVGSNYSIPADCIGYTFLLPPTGSHLLIQLPSTVVENPSNTQVVTGWNVRLYSMEDSSFSRIVNVYKSGSIITQLFNGQSKQLLVSQSNVYPMN
jgi:hypothetical protein